MVRTEPGSSAGRNAGSRPGPKADECGGIKRGSGSGVKPATKAETIKVKSLKEELVKG